MLYRETEIENLTYQNKQPYQDFFRNLVLCLKSMSRPPHHLVHRSSAFIFHLPTAPDAKRKPVMHSNNFFNIKRAVPSKLIRVNIARPRNPWSITASAEWIPVQQPGIDYGNIPLILPFATMEMQVGFKKSPSFNDLKIYLAYTIMR